MATQQRLLDYADEYNKAQTIAQTIMIKITRMIRFFYCNLWRLQMAGNIKLNLMCGENNIAKLNYV